MKRSTLLFLLCLALSLCASASVTGSTDPSQFQDPVDWCTNYGCANVPFSLPSPSPWVSNGGVTGLVGNVGTLQPFSVHQQGTDWSGNFPNGMGVVYNGVVDLGNTPTDIAATFDVGVFGAGAYIQAEHFGVFTATVTLFDINFQPLGSFSAQGDSENGGPTALFIGAFDTTPDVYAIQFNVVDINGQDDFGIGTLKLQTGQVTTPEPGTLMLLGPSALGLFGVLRRRVSRKSQEVL